MVDTQKSKVQILMLATRNNGRTKIIKRTRGHLTGTPTSRLHIHETLGEKVKQKYIFLKIKEWQDCEPNYSE